MDIRSGFLWFSVLAVILLAHPASLLAHGGEDHGAQNPTPSTLPPMATALGFGSEGSVFQAVLTVEPDGRHSRLYLADSDTNQPIAAATIDAESGAWRGTAQATNEPGVYRLDWGPSDQADPLALVISALGRDDLLLFDRPSVPKPTDKAGQSPRLWVKDMPKATQFRLSIRTQSISAQTVADTKRVVGRVIPDPNAYARLQSSQTARIVTDPAIPFPIPGQKIRRGQALMILEPTLTSLERSDKRASLSKVESDIAIQEQELARQMILRDVTPAKLIEQNRIRLDQLRKERQQLAGTALGRETIFAPVDGVISDVHVVPGGVVGTDKVLLEIINPTRLRVDAVIHEFSLADQMTAAEAVTRQIPDMVFPLSLLGISPQLDPLDQGLHAQFAVSGAHSHRLKLGMPVDVYVSTGEARINLAVPRDAVSDIGGQSVVMVRTAPEQFQIRPVQVGRKIGGFSEITTGLSAGERVVIQGMRQIQAIR